MSLDEQSGNLKYHFPDSKGLLCLDIKVNQQLKYWFSI